MCMRDEPILASNQYSSTRVPMVLEYQAVSKRLRSRKDSCWSVQTKIHCFFCWFLDSLRNTVFLLPLICNLINWLTWAVQFGIIWQQLSQRHDNMHFYIYRGRGGGMAMPAESPPAHEEHCLFVCLYVCMYVCMFVRIYLEYGYTCAIR